MSLDPWPELPYAAWNETCATLHLWTQIVGKIRLVRTPWLNHGWQVALYVTPSGLTTSPIPDGDRTFEIRFDLQQHHLDIEVSDGQSRRMRLQPMSVADFRSALFAALRSVDIQVEIDDLPSEIPDAIPFSRDRTHAAYDRPYVQRFGQVLRQCDQVFKTISHRLSGQEQPGAFFLGQFRSGGHAFLGPARAVVYWHGARPASGCDAGSLFA